MSVSHLSDMKKVTNNIRYIGFRSRENGTEKGFFDAEHDQGADWERYLHNVEHHHALQHAATVKVHRVLLSMREEDFRHLMANGGNMKDLARDVMNDLSQRKGVSLQWIGAFHSNTGHPHVHLSFMAVGEDAAGKTHRVRLDKSDIAKMRGTMKNYLDQHIGRELQQTQTIKMRGAGQAIGQSRISDIIAQASPLKELPMIADSMNQANQARDQLKKLTKQKSRSQQKQRQSKTNTQQRQR